MSNKATDELLDEIADLPIDDQIRAVKSVMRSTPTRQAAAMIASPRFTTWLTDNRDRIVELSMRGDLNE